jgi:CRP/FNR family transcriptional regulator, cyclic AMP receptor protein
MGTQVVNNLQADEGRAFVSLSATAAEAIEQAALTTTYPTGVALFSEGQEPRGVFIVRRGRVKLSVSGSDGRTLILRMAEPGDLLGAASVISNREYEATGETQEPSDVSFIRQSDLLRLMRLHGEIALWVTQHLSRDYSSTCREIRDLMLSDSAGEKLARLLVGWLDSSAESKQSGQVKMALTHEEIGQMIGTTRETVSRLLAGFKKRHLIQQRGATLVISNRVALESLITA